MVYVHCKRVRQLVLCDVEFAKADLMSGHSFIQAAGALVLVAQAAAHRRSIRPQLMQVLVPRMPMAWSLMLCQI